MRCGRGSHNASSCYASTHADGAALSPARSRAGYREASGCARCGRDSHDASSCYASTHADGAALSPAHARGGYHAPIVCGRCRRAGHDATTCNASAVGGGSVSSIGSAATSSTAQCVFCKAEGHTWEGCPRRLTYNDPRCGLRAEAPPKGRFVANIYGSSEDDRRVSSSWITEVEQYVGPQITCVALDCGAPAEMGCHVWVRGVRDAYFIAPFCRHCNHRHGHEEICHCRYIGRGEEPAQWIAIRDVWLLKQTATDTSNVRELFAPFRTYCERQHIEGPYAVSPRWRCSRYCSASISK